MLLIVVIVFLVTFFIMGATIYIMANPKLRAKFFASQFKATKYMMDEMKDDIKSIADDMADATKDSITVKTRAVRKGLLEDSKFCKYCGENIDADSVYCNKCGKKQ